MAECNHCHQAVVESYSAVVELVQNGEVTRKASLFGLHHHCARHWAEAETERLRKAYGDDFGVISRVEIDH